ncbi:MAG: AAA-like domain-containing protein, partial [Candidatus Poribacteria bacterium]
SSAPALGDAKLLAAPGGGAVPLDSAFYIARDTDDLFHRAVTRHDSIVLIKGARQMGKTSLLARGLMQARDAGIPAPFTDLQALSMAQVASADAFFKTLAYSLVEQLDLDVMPEDMWTDRLGPGVNFERYVRRVALKEVDQLVWALDEVDRMFATEYASEVFGLYRSWHNKRALDPDGPWSKLTLVIAYATEAHLFIRDVNQSPFNVGTRLELGDFDESQVAELNRRYGSPLTSDEAGRFARLVGGHPYLAQRGFQALIERGMDFPTLEATGAEEDGPYGDHLRRILVLLAQNKERCDTVCDLLAGRSTPDAETFYHLRTAGLLLGSSMQNARFRNDLYSTYLRRHLL